MDWWTRFNPILGFNLEGKSMLTGDNNMESFSGVKLSRME